MSRLDDYEPFEYVDPPEPPTGCCIAMVGGFAWMCVLLGVGLYYIIISAARALL